MQETLYGGEKHAGRRRGMGRGRLGRRRVGRRGMVKNPKAFRLPLASFNPKSF